MIREQGTVTEVRDGKATIVFAAGEHEQCSSCGLCKAAEQGRRVLEDIAAPPGLQPGDKVTVEIPIPGAAGSATVLFLIPLMLFIAALVVCEQLHARNILPGGSGVSVIIALGAMVAWYAAAGLYDRHLTRSPEHQPRIVNATSNDAGN